LQSLSKRRPLTAEEQKELAEHQVAVKSLQKIVRGDGRPDHPKVKQIDQLVAEISRLADKIKPLNVEKAKLLTQFKKNTETIKKINKFLHAAFGRLGNRETHELFVTREAVFNAYKHLDDVTYRQIANYLIGRFENPQEGTNVVTGITPEIQRAYDELEKLSDEYGKLNAQLNHAAMELALSGQGKLAPGDYEDLVDRLPSKSKKYLADQGIIRIFKNYRGEDKFDVYDQARLKRYLVAQIQAFAKEVQMLAHENDLINERITGRTGKPNQAQAIAASIDRAIADMNSQVFKLRSEKNKLVGVEHMTYANYTVSSTLAGDKNYVAKNFVAVNSVLQRLWAEWTKIWGARLEESNEDWY
jgi:predicted nuclease with TOPRIM domain